MNNYENKLLDSMLYYFFFKDNKCFLFDINFNIFFYKEEYFVQMQIKFYSIKEQLLIIQLIILSANPRRHLCFINIMQSLFELVIPA